VILAVAIVDARLEDLDLALGERRSRRMSSSLLPLNMLPAITSIQPPPGRC
jgi:hypothetical protein